MAAEGVGSSLLRNRYLVSGCVAVLITATAFAVPKRLAHATMSPALDTAAIRSAGLLHSPPPTLITPSNTAYLEAVRAMAKLGEANASAAASAAANSPAVTRQANTDLPAAAVVTNFALPPTFATERRVASSVATHAHTRARHPHAGVDDGGLAFQSAFIAAGSGNDNTISGASSSRPQLSAAAASNGITAYEGRDSSDARYDVQSDNQSRLGEVAVRTKSLVAHLAPNFQADGHAKYDALNVRTSVTVPAFRHPVSISLGGGYERLTQSNDGRTISAIDSPTNDTVTGTTNSALLATTNRLNLSGEGYSAAASVPLSHRLNVGVGYSQRSVRGDAGFVQSTPVDQRQALYTGSVTYAPHGGRSSISLVGQATRALDATTSTVDSNVRRGDLLFSVKF